MMSWGSNCSAIPGALWLLVLLSCSSPPRLSNTILEEGYRPSRSSLLEFRLPIGWLEVPSGEGTSDIELWVVSSDFQQSIEVSLISIDPSSGTLEGAESIAQLRLNMMVEGGQTIIDSLGSFADGDRTIWGYTVSDHSGHLRRVSVIDAGSRYFEVRMLSRNPSNEDRPWAMQDEFLRELRVQSNIDEKSE